MPMYPINQKNPGAKNKKVPTKKEVPPRAKRIDAGFPTVQGDLGILNVEGTNIPRQSQAQTKTTNGNTNHKDQNMMKTIMKKVGMLI
jgi:hypothetical protein